MLGSKIKELRVSLGLNQVDFARKLNVTKQSVCNWENNNIQPSIDMLLKIATTYSVSTDYLLGLTPKRELDTTGLTIEQLANLQFLINEIKKSNDV